MLTTTIFSRRIPRAFLICTLVLPLLAECASMNSMEDFRRAREQANRGEGREVISGVMNSIDDLSPDMHGIAVDTVAVVDGPDGQKALLQMLDKPNLRTPQTRKRIVDHLVRRDEPGTVDALYERYRRDPSYLTGEMVEYFGTRRYTPAIPDIKSVVRNGRFVQEGLRALSMMRESEAEKFVLATASNPGQPGRAEAIRSLPRIMHPYYKKNARGLVRQLINQRDVENKGEYLAALSAAGGMGMQEDFFATLKEIHTTSKDPAVRTQALESMARMKGVDSYLMARDLQLPLAEKQSLLSLWKGDQAAASNSRSSGERRTHRRRVSRYIEDPPQYDYKRKRRNRTKSQPSRARDDRRNARRAPTGVAARVEPTPDIPGPRTAADESPKKGEPEAPAPGAGSAYRAKVVETLAGVTPPSVARKLAQRIHNAFMSYKDFNTPSAKFVIRSYRKAFGGDEAAIRGMLGRGLSHPGSLSAVIKNVKAEYPSNEMRVYVIANLFALPRWQASILLEQITF